MTELQEMDKETAVHELQQQPASSGEMLRAARDAKQLTQQDVSNSLRFSVKQIDALEKDDFSLLPDAMITRGFIRNYARLLEIDAEPLLASYRQVTNSQPEKMISVKSTMRPVQLTKESQPWLKYILGSILVLLFLLAWIFYIDYMPKSSSVSVENVSRTAPDTAAAPAESLPEVALPAAQRAAPDETAPDLAAGPNMALNAGGQSLSVPVANPADTFAQPDSQQLMPVMPQQTPSQAAVNPVIAASKVLTLVFTAQSWVSVTDKSGKVVYEKMSRNGDKEVINVTPPLNLVVGNASGTRLNFDGKDIDLAPNTKDNVARITLE